MISHRYSAVDRSHDDCKAVCEVLDNLPSHPRTAPGIIQLLELVTNWIISYKLLYLVLLRALMLVSMHEILSNYPCLATGLINIKYIYMNYK